MMDIEECAVGARVETTEGLDGPGVVIAVDEDAQLVTVKFDRYDYPPYTPDEFDPDDLVQA